MNAKKKIIGINYECFGWELLEIDNLIDYTDPFDHLVDEISKKIKKKNK